MLELPQDVASLIQDRAVPFAAALLTTGRVAQSDSADTVPQEGPLKIAFLAGKLWQRGISKPVRI
jgi:hypothetical protein